MSFSELLSKAKIKIESVLATTPIKKFSSNHPPYVLFFVVSNGLERAHIEIATGHM